MLSSDFTFRTKDGLLLNGQSWRKRGEVRGTLVLIHEYASHVGRLKKLAASLADQNYLVFSFDWRGHGKSEGLRAYLRSMRTWLDDLQLFMERLPTGKGIFFLGQGMGASLLLHALHTRTIEPKGMILLSPGVKLVESVNPLTLVGNRIGSMFLPSLAWSDNVFHWRPSRIFEDKNARRDFVNDPFVYHGGFRNRTAHVLNKAQSLALRRAPAVEVPYLLIHGEQDALFDTQGTRDFHLTAGSKDKTLRLFGKAGHDVLADADRAKVYTAILRWLNKRT